MIIHSECTEPILTYRINGEYRELHSTLPLIVNTEKTANNISVFIDASGSMGHATGFVQEQVRAALKSDAVYYFPGEERWVNWFDIGFQSSPESVTLGFLNESIAYNALDSDITAFLQSYNNSNNKKSSGRVFIINSEGFDSFDLIRQVTRVFSTRLRIKGYSYEVINTQRNLPETGDPNGTSGTSGGGNIYLRHPVETFPIKSAVERFIKALPGKFSLEVFTIDPANLDTAKELLANKQPIPDWLYWDRVLNLTSESDPNPSFYCKGDCGDGYFQVTSDQSASGYICLPRTLLDQVKTVEQYQRKLASLTERLQAVINGR